MKITKEDILKFWTVEQIQKLNKINAFKYAIPEVKEIISEIIGEIIE